MNEKLSTGGIHHRIGGKSLLATSHHGGVFKMASVQELKSGLFTLGFSPFSTSDMIVFEA